jgi:hypothetical protein
MQKMRRDTQKQSGVGRQHRQNNKAHGGALTRKP